MITKIKSLPLSDLNIFDSVQDLVDIKICNSADLFVNDDFLPMVSTDYIKANQKIIIDYLESASTNKIIFLTPYESFSNTRHFLNSFNLIKYASNHQLSIITNGQGPSNWHLLSTDLLNELVGTLYNQYVSLSRALEIYNTKNKPYKFLFLNGALRDHRTKLINLLSTNKLLSKSLWTNVATGVHLNSKYENYYNSNEKIKYINGREHKLTFVAGVLVPELYIDTYFSLVTETNFKNTEPDLTEKIFKPILAGHPFIAVASCGFYRYLRSLGYRTFSPLIDESFDDIQDDDTRLLAIADSVIQLCNTDLDSFLVQTKEICEYNKKVYLENHGRFYYDLRTRMIHFLEKF